MNELAALLTSFDVSVLFPVIKGIADTVGKFLSPVLLLIAIYIRLMETQVDGLVSGGKYGVALRDMVLWTFVLGAYYSIGAYVIEVFNPIYAWLDGFGSLKATMASFSAVIAKNKIAIDAGGITVWGLASSPYVVMAELFYFGSLIIVAFITAFLKVANVLVFGVAFIWGLIAIPISISTTFKILRGWAYLCAFALVWPIVQGLMMAIFALLFTTSTDTLMAVPDANPMLRAANIMMLFSVMHLLLAAVMVSAPFIANALVTNSPSAAAIVMPFVGAAVAAGAGSAMAAGAGSGRAHGVISRMVAGNATSSAGGPTARATPAGAVKPGVPASASPSESNDAGDRGGAVQSSSDAVRQKQRRRGVIVSQNMKKKGRA